MRPLDKSRQLRLRGHRALNHERILFLLRFQRSDRETEAAVALLPRSFPYPDP